MKAGWLVLLSPNRSDRGAAAVKRAMDVAGALVGLTLFAVPMATIALLVRLNLGSPVLFRQRRPGRDGRPFEIYKFRTMTDGRSGSGEPLADSARLKRLGRFLRRTSLDELPEFFNVLKGDMSLVGPRPLLMEYLDLYSPEQARRHEVRPGMTGWAQVNGRNALSWEEKFEHDTWYVDHWSLRLDLKILLSTMMVVARGRGVSQPGKATVEYFKGSARGPEVGEVEGGSASEGAGESFREGAQ